MHIDNLLQLLENWLIAVKSMCLFCFLSLLLLIKYLMTFEIELHLHITCSVGAKTMYIGAAILVGKQKDQAHML